MFSLVIGRSPRPEERVSSEKQYLGGNGLKSKLEKRDRKFGNEEILLVTAD